MAIKNNIFKFTCLLLLLAACQERVPIEPLLASQKVAYGKKAAIACAHPLATEAGLNILRKGGNAVDAAIAVQAVLAVVYPRAGNFGGGGFMVYRDKQGEVYALDFREKAPLLSTEGQYTDNSGTVIPERSTLGIWAVGIPGTPEGMLKMHEKFGTLSMATLLQPAYELADKGFLINEKEAHRLMAHMEVFNKQNPGGHPFQKTTWRQGDRLVQKELAKSIRQMQEKGLRDFYQGTLAQSIVNESQKRGGILSKEDLNSYQAIWREPLIIPYQNRTLVAMPLPSSGGIALAQIFNAKNRVETKEPALTSAQKIALDVELFKQVYRDRIQYLGDEDFIIVNKDSLLSKKVAEQMVKRMYAAQHPEKEHIPKSPTLPKESYETTHVSILDAEGNALSLTTTLNSNYGSKVWVEGTGILLNNQMDDFTVKVGALNQFGIPGSSANKIEPSKRMLSSMSPTIVLNENQVELIVGSPGGSTIITTVYRIINACLDHGAPLEKAVRLPRYHHQWVPNEILRERNTLQKTTIDSLVALGYTLREVDYIGLVNAIQIRKDSIIAVSDNRGEDSCGAY
jgi:gamma-glutamyltranspeptidase / glutathione hydrolase